MAKLALILLGILALVPGAGAGGHAPLVGVDRAGAVTLREATTLAVLPGRRAEVDGPPSAWARSPDGSRVAIASGYRVSIFETSTLRAVQELRRAGLIFALAWPSARRLIAFDASHCAVKVIDPVAGRTVASRSLPCVLQATSTWRDGLVLLVAPGGAIAAPTLVVADARGVIRAVTLEGVRAGMSRTRNLQAALAIDPAGRAFVLARDSPVAVVRLATLAPTLHRLPPTRTVQRAAKEYWARSTAHWLGGGLLAATGLNDDFSDNGLDLIDTRTWTRRRVDADVRAVAVGGGLVLGYAGTGYGGITGYTRNGRAAFTRFAHETVLDVQVRDRLAYVFVDGSLAAFGVSPRLAVLELPSGRVHKVAPTPARVRLLVDL